MKRFRKRLVLLLRYITLGILLPLISCSPTDEELVLKELILATAHEQGGHYYSLGKDLAYLINERLRYPPVIATPSQGSFDNVKRLLKDEAQLGLVSASTLHSLLQDKKSYPTLTTDLTVILKLYADIVQVVVPHQSKATSLKDLFTSDQTPTLYIGSEMSGTKIMAEYLIRLVEPNAKYNSSDATSYQAAADALEEHTIDGAFFVAAIPTPAVEQLLKKSFKLLDLSDAAQAITNQSSPGASPYSIPEYTYREQKTAVATVKTDTFLLGHQSLPNALVEDITEAIIEPLDELNALRGVLENLRFPDVFSAPGLRFHPAVQRYKQIQEKSLLILTGALYGKYYEIGKMLKEQVEKVDIDTTVSHSHGSFENLDRLLQRTREELPTVALMQHDTALVALLEGTKRVHGIEVVPARGNNGKKIPSIPELRRIATLHPEKIHVLVQKSSSENSSEQNRGMGLLSGKTVHIGAEDSGSQLLSRALMKHFVQEGIIDPPPTYKWGGVNEMIDGLIEGRYDAGMFTAFAPSNLIRRALRSGKLRLVSIDLGWVSCRP